MPEKIFLFFASARAVSQATHTHMSLLPTESRSRDPVSTDWDDIQRRLGNLPPLEEEAAALAWEPEEASDRALQQRLGPAEGGAPGCSDDASADTDALEQWRAERLAQLKGLAGGFGTLVLITREQFVAEVNRAGDGVGVVVFLHKPKHYPSAYMEVLLERLAAKHRAVKFCRIGHHDCIPDYPDANLPTLLMYRDDDLLRQCVGLAAFGGDAYGVDDVEWELAEAGLVSTDLPANPHAQRHR